MKERTRLIWIPEPTADYSTIELLHWQRWLGFAKWKTIEIIAERHHPKPKKGLTKDNETLP